MSRDDAHPLPAKDPFSGGPLVITELESVESGVTIRGRFAIPRFARLSGDQARYLETFLRCRGMLNSVEKELGISYPTARARLDAVLKALDLHAVREDSSAGASPSVEETPQEAMPVAQETPEAESLPEWESSDPEIEFSYEEPASEEPPPEPEPVAEPEPEAPRRTRDELLSLLERGEIGVDELKKELERAR